MRNMRILLIDCIGGALDWAMRCQDAGHDIRVWMKPRDGEKRNPIGDGYVKTVPEWKPHMQWADLIFLTDNANLMEELEPYQKRGYPIFGPNIAAAKMELDRQFGQDIFKKCGIKTMPSVEFNDYDKAKEYVASKMERFVCKPNSDVDKALSYVAKSPRDMIGMLDRWKTEAPQSQGFILQPFVGGIEMAIGGWFGKKGFSKWYTENAEFKKHLPGDTGVNTGEQGTVMRYVKESKLVDKLLTPLTSYLHSINYRGYIDVAAIIDDKGVPWPLEFTSRPGWPCFTIQSSLHIGDPSRWMKDLLDGEDTLEVLDETAVGIVATIPDYPFTQYTKRNCTGYPIYNTERLVMEDIHYCEVMLGDVVDEEDDKIVYKKGPVTCGDYVLIATGTDFDIHGAQKRAKRALKTIEISHSPGWRDDIGERLEKQLPVLQDMGYALEWHY
jgi:phosphoribosylamine--glycine ligase